MFIRQKRNKSGSVQIISKSAGKYNVVESIGSGKSEQEISTLLLKARSVLRQLQGNLELFTDEEESAYENILSSISNNQIQVIGPELIYGNLSPAKFVRIFLNGGIDYTDLDAKTLSLKNNGFAGRIIAGSQFNLPKDYSINLQGGYFSSTIMLQGKQSPFYFTGINIGKSFFKKKLSVSVSMQNPFWKTMKMEMTTSGDHFSYVSTNWRNSREFRLSVSYRFGTLKEKIKKVRRSIKNDDVKGGNYNANSGKSQEM